MGEVLWGDPRGEEGELQRRFVTETSIETNAPYYGSPEIEIRATVRDARGLALGPKALDEIAAAVDAVLARYQMMPEIVEPTVRPDEAREIEVRRLRDFAAEAIRRPLYRGYADFSWPEQRRRLKLERHREPSLVRLIEHHMLVGVPKADAAAQLLQRFPGQRRLIHALLGLPDLEAAPPALPAPAAPAPADERAHDELLGAIAAKVERAREMGREVNAVELGRRELALLGTVAGSLITVPVEGGAALTVIGLDVERGLSVYRAG